MKNIFFSILIVWLFIILITWFFIFHKKILGLITINICWFNFNYRSIKYNKKDNFLSLNKNEYSSYINFFNCFKFSFNKFKLGMGFKGFNSCLENNKILGEPLIVKNNDLYKNYKTNNNIYTNKNNDLGLWKIQFKIKNIERKIRKNRKNYKLFTIDE